MTREKVKTSCNQLDAVHLPAAFSATTTKTDKHLQQTTMEKTKTATEVKNDTLSMYRTSHKFMQHSIQ